MNEQHECLYCKGIGVVGPVEKRDESQLLDFTVIKNSEDLKKQLSEGKVLFHEVWAGPCLKCGGSGKYTLQEQDLSGDERNLLYELTGNDYGIPQKLITPENVRRVNFLAVSLGFTITNSKAKLFKERIRHIGGSGLIVDAPMPDDKEVRAFGGRVYSGMQKENKEWNYADKLDRGEVI